MPAITRTLVAWLAALSLGISAPLCWAQPTPTAESDRNETRADRQPDTPVESPAPAPATIVLRDYLILPRVGEYGRRLVALDPIDAAMTSGDWKTPTAGDKVTAASGKSVSWRQFSAKEDGAIKASEAGGGYAVTTIDSAEEKVWLLEARNHVAVCVNGRWLTGDLYDLGWVRLPIKLTKGANQLLFHMARPGFQARLVEPLSHASFISENATLPDIAPGQQAELWAAVPIVNATSQPLQNARLLISIDQGDPVAVPLPALPALSVRKTPFAFHAPTNGAVEGHSLQLTLSLPEGDGYHEAATIHLPLDKVKSTEPHTRTFVSKIDGSVQPYIIIPSVEPTPKGEKPGVILALHGLGVDPAKFASHYVAKNWAHVVVPQGRSQYEFDWEDWAAKDAMEALADAQSHFPHNPLRTYATGHSLGGHGAWRLGVTHPDRFAAIGPSAGWVSHWTYGGGMPAYENPTAVQAMLLRAAAPSDTAKLTSNLSGLGVYLLHGQRDKNVGVSQSRYMRARLGEFHSDFAYHERRGAGNWWGDACCDWPEMMEFFRTRLSSKLENIGAVDFVTPTPSLLAEAHWARVEAQDFPGELSRINLRLSKKSSKFVGSTKNVRRLSLDASFLPKNKPVKIQLDGRAAVTAKPAHDGRVWLTLNDSGRWSATPPPPGGKHAARHGDFKSVFDNNALLVYGTSGSPEENSWAEGKANFDAQTFWYRGNGSLEVIADADFDASRERKRNVVLYGNSETNLAWPALLSTCPIQVRGGRVGVSSQGVSRPESGEGLAVLFVYPRPGSQNALVGVVGGAGLPGMRLTNRVRYFKSGVNLPDFTLLGPRAAIEGESEVRATGYFGHDWRVETGQIVWRDIAL